MTSSCPRCVANTIELDPGTVNLTLRWVISLLSKRLSGKCAAHASLESYVQLTQNLWWKYRQKKASKMTHASAQTTRIRTKQVQARADGKLMWPRL